jgi:U4/U6.U5 tri-snRNP-associated protein 1
VPPASDYLDISEIKVKKPKKKKNKSTRQKAADDDDVFSAEAQLANDQLMDMDSNLPAFTKKRKIVDDSFVDDEDLQASLDIQRKTALKKRKKMRPEDIAKQLKEEAVEEPEETQPAGLVLNDISEFVAALRNPDEEEERKPRKAKTPVEGTVAAVDDGSEDEDHPMNGDEAPVEVDIQREPSVEDDFAAIGVDEEKTVGRGMGDTLQLLKERGLIHDTNGGQLNTDFRQRSEFLAKKRLMQEESNDYARQQRERDRASGRMERMSERDKQEIARQQNERRDLQQSRQMAQLFSAEYKPKVELKYTDEYGRSLDQKEAFKHLSHQFHGKGSGKGKTDKRLKKIEDEKRRESQSVLDASQNVGMSSATAQQLKKRKEAGVRLA